MVAFYAATMFVSALLLFLVQPMIGKMILPLLGGSPAVWNTCMVFFQALLLAGYAYAHWSTQAFGVRRQARIHRLVLVLPLVALGVAAAIFGEPVHVIRALAPQGTAYPFFGVVALLAVTIGLPFFVVSTTAPLLQRWFADTDHRDAQDPYFLYGASNVGSLLALAAYPVLVEPTLRLSQQGWMWSIGYFALAGFIYACVGRLQAAPPPKNAAIEADIAITWSRRLRWVLLALVPASLLLGVTTFSTTDITPRPLLWVIPLALYLLTFIIAFGRRPRWVALLNGAVAPALALILLFTLVWNKKLAWYWIMLGLHYVVFFSVALMCHIELVRLRPEGRRSTEFYLWMSLGGVLGGLFNALVAPLVFKDLTEYPLVIALACFFVPASDAELKSSGRARALDVLIPLALFGVMWLLQMIPSDTGGFDSASSWLKKRTGDWLLLGPDSLWAIVVLGIPALAVFYNVDRPLRFGLGALAFWAAGTMGIDRRQAEYVVHRDRSFFGRLEVERDYRSLENRDLSGASNTTPIVITAKAHGLTNGQAIEIAGVKGLTSANGAWYVTVVDADRFSLNHSAGNGDYDGGGQWSITAKLHTLLHGTTLHGMQMVDPKSDEPLTYYHRTGPLGQLFRAFDFLKRSDIAAVGLGTGSVAAYGEPTNAITFYEIDPTVRRIAENTNYFTYLHDCKAGRLDFVMGDARLKLEEHGQPGQYGLIIVDAFSSDAIPIHLLTQEAVALYMSRLKENGIVALHLSNRYLRLEPVTARIAAALGLAGLQINDADQDIVGKRSSQWVVLARKPEYLAPLRSRPDTIEFDNRKIDLSDYRWRDLEVDDAPLWTDDFSNILSVMVWDQTR